MFVLWSGQIHTTLPYVEKFFGKLIQSEENNPKGEVIGGSCNER